MAQWYCAGLENRFPQGYPSSILGLGVKFISSFFSFKFMTYALIKVSGDLYQNPSTIDFIRRISAKGDTVVCVGGGTQINQALLTAGYSLKKHGPLGRELYSQKEI